MQNISGTSWSDQFRSSNGLNSTATAWKDLMSNFLLESSVFGENDINALKTEIKISDPNIMMNLRHEMVRNCSTVCHPKFCATSKEAIMTEARRLIRQENLERQAKEKEARIVNKEIEQLKQSLENNRILRKMELQANSGERKNTCAVPKFIKKQNPKVWKRYESYDSCWEIDTWFAGGCGPNSTNVSLKDKCHHNNKSLPNFKVTVKKKDTKEIPIINEEDNEESSSALTSNKDDSEVSFKTQIEMIRDDPITRIRHWDDSQSNGKNEIMQRFFQSANEIDRIKQIYKTRAQIENSKLNGIANRKCEIENITCEMITEEDDIQESKFEKQHRKVYDDLSDDDVSWARFETKDAQLKIEVIKDYLKKSNIRYYWKLWRRFILDQKIQKEKLNREEKIETFLKRLMENKNESLDLEVNVQCKRKDKRSKNTQSSKTVQKEKPAVKERLKTAPMILENKFREQKEKINHRKRDIVEKDHCGDVTLKEIEQEVTQSSKEALEQLNKKFHPSLRGRVKVLKTISNLGRNKVEKIEAEMQKVFPVPEVLSRMEKRDQERKKKWDEIRERKRKLQEEREKLQREKEEEMKQIEENEKKRKLDEVKEKRRLEKEAEEQRRRERELLRQQTKQAQEHHRRALLRNLGMNPWKCLMRFRSLQEEQAVSFYEERLMRSHFFGWWHQTQEEMSEKQLKTEDFYNRSLLRHCLQVWIEECNEKIKQFQAAVDWADMKLTERTFHAWLEFVQIEQLEYLDKEDKAEAFYMRTLKTKHLKKWMCYPELRRLEKEKEERKRVWRQKVQEVLPDYRPMRISEQI